jgi:hypothetical protein
MASKRRAKTYTHAEYTEALQAQRAELEAAKNQGYYERNQLVLALSKLFPAWLERHPITETDWDDDWRWIVFMEVPVTGPDGAPRTEQLSWHIHDAERPLFDHLAVRDADSWDGHTTAEKYARLARLRKP